MRKSLLLLIIMGVIWSQFIQAFSCRFLLIKQKNGIKLYGTHRTFLDGTVAESCDGYKNPVGNRFYIGDIGSGIYSIKPDSNPSFDVYCDMNSDSFGWTLALILRDDGRFGYDDVFWSNYTAFNNSITNLDPTTNTNISVATPAVQYLKVTQLKAIEKVERYDTYSYNGSCYNFGTATATINPPQTTIWRNNGTTLWNNSTGFTYLSGQNNFNLNKNAYVSASTDVEVRARWGTAINANGIDAYPRGFGLRSYGTGHSCHRNGQWGGYLLGNMSYLFQGNHSNSIDVYIR